MIIALIAVLILITLALQGKRLSQPTSTGTPSSFDVSNSGGTTEELETDDSNLFHSPVGVMDDGIYYQSNPPTFEQSRAEISKIISRLPARIPNIRTSAGITTSITLSVRETGNPNVLALHINGVNYHESQADSSNSQYTAFVESLERAKSELQHLGADPALLLVSFGTRQYEVETANIWARVSGVL